MQTARLLCLLIMATMAWHFGSAIAATGIHQGLGADVFFAGYAANVWQAGINADLLAGLALMAAWIGWRERSAVSALVWINALFYWGNIVAAVYLYRALSGPEPGWDQVLMGHRAAHPLPEHPRQPWPLAVQALLIGAAATIAGYVGLKCLETGVSPVQMMGYVGGLGSAVPVLLRMAWLGRAHRA